jgi:putative intracellular protease/amidase
LKESTVTAQTTRDPESSEEQASLDLKLIGIVLFDSFETLDVFGPVQMWGRLPCHRLLFISADGRPVRSSQGVVISASCGFAQAPQLDILMVPGGEGLRELTDDPALLAFVQRQDRETTWTVSVCTGAAILAKAGVLDGRAATSNKLALAWVRSQSDKVRWQGRARWVFDGKYVTSSGVSAGTDMAIALIQQLYGPAEAAKVVKLAEYDWNDNPLHDPYAAANPA